jgi:nucleotide-binding universal stress UspA family protein
MRQEAQDEARTVLAQAAARARSIGGIVPEQVIREGETAEQVQALIEEDQDIAVLVLAAGTAKEGPGPLVSGLTKTVATFPIPIAIVPGQLSDQDIDALA